MHQVAKVSRILQNEALKTVDLVCHKSDICPWRLHLKLLPVQAKGQVRQVVSWDLGLPELHM